MDSKLPSLYNSRPKQLELSSDLCQGVSNSAFSYIPEHDDILFAKDAVTEDKKDVTTSKLQNNVDIAPSVTDHNQNEKSSVDIDNNNGLFIISTGILETDCEKNGTHNPQSITGLPKPNQVPVPKEYQGMKRYLGLFLTLLASFCFSLVVLFVKILKQYGFEPYGGSFWRYTGTITPTIPLLIFCEWGPPSKKHDTVFKGIWPPFKNENWKTWLGLMSRGLLGSTAVICRYYALQYLTVGDTLVITYSTPVLVAIMAHFFLGEKCGVFPIITAFFTLCGVVIVAKPPIITGAKEFDTGSLIGTGFACGSLCCGAIMVIVTRKIRKVHFTVTVLVVGTIGICHALTMSYFMGHFNFPKELYDSLLVVGVSGFSFLGQISIILALKYEQAGPVSLIRSCDVLFGFLFQYVFLNVIPDKFSAVGAGIVLVCVLSIGFRKWLNTLPDKDRKRKIWWFILK